MPLFQVAQYHQHQHQQSDHQHQYQHQQPDHQHCIPIMLIEIAVVVWFHGGGLASGLGGMYEPHFIMDYQVKVI